MRVLKLRGSGALVYLRDFQLFSDIKLEPMVAEDTAAGLA
jgi:hypothetical protein